MAQGHGGVPARDVDDRGDHGASQEAMVLGEVISELETDLDLARRDAHQSRPDGAHEPQAGEAATDTGLELGILGSVRAIDSASCGLHVEVSARRDVDHAARSLHYRRNTTWSNPSA